ncbi:uncharacterized protein VTP21DRAFT_592 [Calcarisporiella thermophila]|uniref:uncharacterized protein n=1 Tax=Calcarisporiella thermophila TaxID=911321 RepID=UPI0037441DAF
MDDNYSRLKFLVNKITTTGLWLLDEQDLKLTVGIHQKDLPPPTSVAEKLKQLSLALVHQWCTKYGDAYKQLDLGKEYLQQNLNLDLSNNILTEQAARAKEEEARQARIKAIKERKFQQYCDEIAEEMPSLEETIKEMRSCFEILIPIFERTSSQPTPGLSTFKDMAASYGLGSSRYTLTITISRDKPLDFIDENPENKIVYDTMREFYRVMVKKQEPLVSQWINALTKLEIEDTKALEEQLKQLIDIRTKFTEIKEKAEMLGANIDTSRPGAEEQEENEDGLEQEFFGSDEEQAEFMPHSDGNDPQEGPSNARSTHEETSTNKAREENSSSKQLPKTQRIFQLADEPGLEEDVTYHRNLPQVLMSMQKLDERTSEDVGKGKQAVRDNGAMVEDEEGKQQKPTKEELLKIAPVVPWADDLYYWDKDDLQFNTTGLGLSEFLHYGQRRRRQDLYICFLIAEFHHRFLGDGTGEKNLSRSTMERLKMRTVYYQTQRPQMIKACRAPLKTGKLCSRRDLRACPFHGPIIPRDEWGRPVKVEKSTENRSEKQIEKVDEEDLLEVEPREGGEAEEEEEEEEEDQMGAPKASTISEGQQLSWEELEDDVMRQVGQEKISTTKKRKTTKPSSYLIDIKKKPQNSITRLESRLRDPKMKRRVEEAERYHADIKRRNRKANVW